jgi:uncharacterized protein (DUF488 family)
MVVNIYERVKFTGDKAMSSKRAKDRTDALLTVLTIGHSTRTIEEFIQLLQAHCVKCVVDVRTVPRSWHNPQFNRDTLPASLKAVHIDYEHMAGLGGLRHAQRDSINMGWRNVSFRGYADYMQTPEFEGSLETLIKLAKHERIALMCAEAVPWRCHRSMIGDALVVRGIQVEDIMSINSHRSHSLTSFAKVKGLHITYPPADSASGKLKLKKNNSVNASCQRQKILRKQPVKTK